MFSRSGERLRKDPPASLIMHLGRVESYLCLYPGVDLAAPAAIFEPDGPARRRPRDNES